MCTPTRSHLSPPPQARAAVLRAAPAKPALGARVAQARRPLRSRTRKSTPRNPALHAAHSSCAHPTPGSLSTPPARAPRMRSCPSPHTPPAHVPLTPSPLQTHIKRTHPQAIQTFAAAVKTVDPKKAVGKSAALWLGFSKFYEKHGDLPNARVILRKASLVPYRSVEASASTPTRAPPPRVSPGPALRFSPPPLFPHPLASLPRPSPNSSLPRPQHVYPHPPHFPERASPGIPTVAGVRVDRLCPHPPAPPVLAFPGACERVDGLGGDGAAPPEARRGARRADRGHRHPARIKTREREGARRTSSSHTLTHTHAPLSLTPALTPSATPPSHPHARPIHPPSYAYRPQEGPVQDRFHKLTKFIHTLLHPLLHALLHALLNTQ